MLSTWSSFTQVCSLIYLTHESMSNPRHLWTHLGWIDFLVLPMGPRPTHVIIVCSRSWSKDYLHSWCNEDHFFAMFFLHCWNVVTSNLSKHQPNPTGISQPQIRGQANAWVVLATMRLLPQHELQVMSARCECERYKSWVERARQGPASLRSRVLAVALVAEVASAGEGESGRLRRRGGGVAGSGGRGRTWGEPADLQMEARRRSRRKLKPTAR